MEKIQKFINWELFPVLGKIGYKWEKLGKVSNLLPCNHKSFKQKHFSFRKRCTHMKWYLKQTVRIQSSAEASGTSVQWIVVSQDIMIFSVDLNHYAWKLNQLKNGIQTISMHLNIYILYILLEVCSASVVFFWDQ